jgi:hypothetical protein
MTSNVSKNAYLGTPSERQRFIKADKNGIPVDKQIPRTWENYSGAGGATVVPNGSHSYNVLGVLAGVLTINCTDVSNFVGRSLLVTVRGGATQNVVINFPAAGYDVRVKGAAGSVTSYTIAANANNQNIMIDFRSDGAFIVV